MDKDSVMYQLMGMRVNTVLNSIVEVDEDYQKIARRAGECLDRLNMMGLPQEFRQLIDKYASEQNALTARYGALAYLLGFSDCNELSRSTLRAAGHGEACTAD